MEDTRSFTNQPQCLEHHWKVRSISPGKMYWFFDRFDWAFLPLGQSTRGHGPHGGDRWERMQRDSPLNALTWTPYALQRASGSWAGTAAVTFESLRALRRVEVDEGSPAMSSRLVR